MTSNAEQTGWIRGMLTSIVNTQPSTQQPNVVPINTSIDVNKLLKDIRLVSNELVIATAERGKIDIAVKHMTDEYNQMIAENAAKQAEIGRRLDELRERLAKIAREHGVPASVVPAAVQEGQT